MGINRGSGNSSDQSKTNYHQNPELTADERASERESEQAVPKPTTHHTRVHTLIRTECTHIHAHMHALRRAYTYTSTHLDLEGLDERVPRPLDKQRLFIRESDVDVAEVGLVGRSTAVNSPALHNRMTWIDARMDGWMDGWDGRVD